MVIFNYCLYIHPDSSDVCNCQYCFDIYDHQYSFDRYLYPPVKQGPSTKSELTELLFVISMTCS